MSDITFEWHERKSRANKRTHKVSFEEAQTVFLDENATRFFDPDYSQDEDRFLMLGMSFTLRVLVVCHCYRQDDSVMRIISARKADKQEQSVPRGQTCFLCFSTHFFASASQYAGYNADSVRMAPR